LRKISYILTHSVLVLSHHKTPHQLVQEVKVSICATLDLAMQVRAICEGEVEPLADAGEVRGMDTE
jgi:hypothetical protein